MDKKAKATPQELQVWIEARRRHRLSDAHVQMAREMGLNRGNSARSTITAKSPGRCRYPTSSRICISRDSAGSGPRSSCRSKSERSERRRRGLSEKLLGERGVLKPLRSLLVSEYQYYEFLAVDCPLHDSQMNELRALSTRARITATSFVNTYEWGTFAETRAL
jgi:hypothetical protein